MSGRLGTVSLMAKAFTPSAVAINISESLKMAKETAKGYSPLSITRPLKKAFGKTTNLFALSTFLIMLPDEIPKLHHSPSQTKPTSKPLPTSLDGYYIGCT